MNSVINYIHHLTTLIINIIIIKVAICFLTIIAGIMTYWAVVGALSSEVELSVAQIAECERQRLANSAIVTAAVAE